MDEEPNIPPEYHYAFQNHPDFTRIMAGIGAFVGVEGDRDESDLRALVRVFLASHTNVSRGDIEVRSRETVPCVDSYVEACRTQALVDRVAPAIGSRSLVHYGLRGDFTHFDRLRIAYKATLSCLYGNVRKSTELHMQLQLNEHLSEQGLWLASIDAPERQKIEYANTLRQLASHRMISAEMLEIHRVDLGLRPSNGLLRRFKSR